MRNVLHILPLSRKAGLETMFLNYIKYMKKQNPEYIASQHILAINISDYFKQELLALGVKLYETKKLGKFDLSSIRIAKKIVREKNIEIVYGQNFIGNTLAAIVCLFNNKLKLVCHEHGTSWNVKGITSFLTYLWILKSDIIICNSRASYFLLKKRFKASQKKLSVIYNGVPKRPKRDVIRDNKKILFVGRLDVVKSPHTLIHMMSHLVKWDKSLKLEIVGEGSCESDLKNLCKELNIESNVIFQGSVEDVDVYMASASILLLPSIRESLGNVTIEAAFQETPTIATKVDGIPEVILNGETGILVEPKEKIYNNVPVQKVVNLQKEVLQEPLSPSTKEFSCVVKNLLSNKNKLEIMGINAFNYVTRKFSLKTYYEEITKLLQTL